MDLEVGFATIWESGARVPVKPHIRFRRIRSPHGKQSAHQGGDDHVPPVRLRCGAAARRSVAIELNQSLVADPEVMRDLVEHDMCDLAA